jgi:hypothetical protein
MHATDLQFVFSSKNNSSVLKICVRKLSQELNYDRATSSSKAGISSIVVRCTDITSTRVVDSANLYLDEAAKKPLY